MLNSNDSSSSLYLHLFVLTWPLFTSPLWPGARAAEPLRTPVAEEVHSEPLPPQEERPMGHPLEQVVEVSCPKDPEQKVEGPASTPAKNTTLPPEATPFYSPSLVAIAETKEWFVFSLG